MKDIKILLINPNPTRDSIVLDVDKRIIEYHKNKDLIGIEKGDQRHEPNNGLLSIGAFLLKQSFRVEYLDISAREAKHFREFKRYFSRQEISQILEEKAKDADFVLISCLSPSINNSLRMIDYIKTINPGSVNIIGGIFPTLNQDYCIEKCKNIDVLVIGEGEIIVPKIIKAYLSNDFSEIDLEQGIVYKKPDREEYISLHGHNVVCDLNLLEDPAFELLQEESKPFVYRVFTARGCSFACSFCAPSYVSGHKLRKVSPDKVVAAISKLKSKFQAESFVLGDLTFFDDQEHSRAVLNKIIQADINIPFWCQTRLDRINKENIALLKKAGCKQIAIGIESYNNSILAMINKGIWVDNMVEKLLLIKKYGIEIQAYFIVGLPDEKRENIKRTIKFADYLIKKGCLDLTHISIYVPYPGLPLPKNINIIDKNYNHYYQGVFLDMPPMPVYETRMLDQSSILNLWLEFLQRITQAYKNRNESKAIDNEKGIVLGSEALTIAGEIEDRTKLSSNKRGIFNIVQGIRENYNSFVSKLIHEDENYIIGDAEIYTIDELVSVLQVIDGMVDYILLDADIKMPLSREFIRKAYQVVKKSKIYPYSDMAIWSRSAFLLIQHEIEHIENASICLSPVNTFSTYLGDMLKKRGADVVYYDPSYPKEQGIELMSEEDAAAKKIDIYVNFSFGKDIIDKEFIDKLSKDTVIIDATTEGISPEVYELILRKKLSLLRPEMRPLLSSQMFLLESYDKYINSTKGWLPYQGYTFVSGGVIGKRGDIVVDSINKPKKIIGIADGKGKIIRPKNLNKEDIGKIQKANLILKKI